MKNVGVFLAAIAALLLLACPAHPPALNQPPDVPSRPAMPDFVHYFDTTWATTWASDPDGDSIRCQFAWGPGESTYSASAASADSIRVMKVWTVLGVHHVCVRAMDAHEDFSGWSESLTVIVENYPPLVESITGPDTGEVGYSYTFAVWARDPEGCQVAYQFDWGNGDTTGWSDVLPVGSRWASSHRWISAGIGTVRARARDLQGVISDWSPPRTIQVRGPVLAWRYFTGGYVRGVPAIGPDGTIYCGTGSVFALSPDGTLKWRSAAGGAKASPAVGPDGTIYGPGDAQHLYALNSDGSLRWSQHVHFRSGNEHQAVALGPDGTIYCGDKTLIALSPDDSLKWEYDAAQTPHSSPVVGRDGTIYYVAETGHLLALRPDSTLRWEYPLLRVNHYTAPPAIGADGTIYCTGYGALRAIAPDGSLRWDCPLIAGSEDLPMQPVIATDGTIYVSDGVNLYAVSRGGTLRWTAPCCGKAYGPVWGAVAADGTIYVVGPSGPLNAIASDGTVKWRYWPLVRFRSGPTIGPDGTVYIGSSDYYFYALKGSAPLAVSPWPKFQHDLQNTGCAGARWIRRK